MKIAVPSTENELISDMDQSFGRAHYFIIVDPATLEYEAIENKQNLNLPHGAGIQAAKTVADQDTNVLITRNCGPKAFDVLNAAGIKVITGAKEERVIDAVMHYKNGQLKASEGPNVEGHWL